MSLPTRSQAAVAPFVTVSQEFDNMLTRLFNPPAVTRAGGRMADLFVAAPHPVDVREDADRLYVEVDLPGFKKDDVEITLEDQTLTLTAERKAADPASPQLEYLLNERRPAKLRRTFKLPTTVGEQAVSATLVDGVLTVTLTKREEAKPRKITVA